MVKLQFLVKNYLLEKNIFTKSVEKLLRIKKTNYKFKKKINIFKKGNLQIELKDQKSQGQKISETFKERDENFFIIKSDKEILVIPFLSDKFKFKKKIANIKKKNN